MNARDFHNSHPARVVDFVTGAMDRTALRTAVLKSLVESMSTENAELESLARHTAVRCATWPEGAPAVIRRVQQRLEARKAIATQEGWPSDHLDRAVTAFAEAATALEAN